MATDFFDEDLSDGAVSAPPARNESESYYDRRKREIPEQLSQTGDEIERLKQRQEALERRKKEILEQRRRVELFEHNRKDLLEKLRRNAVMVVRESEQASRTAALCNEVGTLFSKLHQELETFSPETWSEEEYDAHLTEALAKVDAATAEYRKAMDQVSAVNWRGTEDSHTDTDPSFPSEGRIQGPDSLKRWFIAGLAFATAFSVIVGGIVAIILLFFGHGGN